MKKILLLSDTHGHFDEAIRRHVAEADEVWHAGDWGGNMTVSDALVKLKPLRGVYGNIDCAELRHVHPEILRFEVEGLRVLMMHIGGYPGHFPQKVKSLIRSERPGLFICGHSHILRVMRDPDTGTLCMNPGAAGIHGFHKVRTMLRFRVDAGKIIQPEVIELGLRASIDPQPEI